MSWKVVYRIAGSFNTLMLAIGIIDNSQLAIVVNALFVAYWVHQEVQSDDNNNDNNYDSKWKNRLKNQTFNKRKKK